MDKNSRAIQNYKKIVEKVLLKFLPIKYDATDLEIVKNNDKKSSSVFIRNNKIYFRRKSKDTKIICLETNGLNLNTKFISVLNQTASGKNGYELLKKLYLKGDDRIISVELIYKMIIEESMLAYLSSILSKKILKASFLLSNIFEKYYTIITDTYEGNKITEVAILGESLNASSTSISYLKKLSMKSLNPLINLSETLVEIDSNGNIKEYISSQKFNDTIDDKKITPYKYSFITNHLEKNKESILAFAVNEYGEILIFKKGEIIFKYSKNMWYDISYYNFESYFLKILGHCTQNKENIKRLFNIILDASFSRKGACIGVIEKNDLNNFISENKNILLISKEEAIFTSCSVKEKSSMIKGINKDWNFSSIDRIIYSELLSLDGASIIVVDEDCWDIVCVGGIITPTTIGDGGGRLAASKSLSKYGMGIKVSSDGGVSIFGKNFPKEYTFM